MTQTESHKLDQYDEQSNVGLNSNLCNIIDSEVFSLDFYNKFLKLN